MINLSRLFQVALLSCVVASGTVGAADGPPANEKDALRATLIESKDKNKGVTLHASGASIAMVVTALEERYVIGRSQQASRIIVRLDRIDGVSAAF